MGLETDSEAVVWNSSIGDDVGENLEHAGGLGVCSRGSGECFVAISKSES